jgi:O-antigen/teichoic acid export membrane protein
LFTIGQEYLGAVYPLQILLIAMGLSAAISPYSALFYLFDRPQYYAYAGIMTALFLIVGDYYLIPQIGISGAAYVRLAVKTITLIFTVYYAFNSLHKHLKKV